MTNKEAIEAINANYPPENYTILREALDMAIALLEEQEPKKVMWRIGRAHCPSCGELFRKQKENQYIRFCNYCGQAVKWE